jgi:hypothetical protein
VMKYDPASGSKIQRIVYLSLLADRPRLQKTVRVGGSVAIHIVLVVVTVAVVGWALTL